MIRLAEAMRRRERLVRLLGLVQVEGHLGDDQALQDGVGELECVLLAPAQVLDELASSLGLPPSADLPGAHCHAFPQEFTPRLRRRSAISG